MVQVIEKKEVFDRIEKGLVSKGFRIIGKDENRPWGGFFVIDEAQSQLFADEYFDKIPLDEIKKTDKLSPKILIVAPEKRLSWQYHYRRAELWKVVDGRVKIAKSESDADTLAHVYYPGDIVVLSREERHRLIGFDTWGIVAEIWQHTDAEHPSDEQDIVRLQDDYGR